MLTPTHVRGLVAEADRLECDAREASPEVAAAATADLDQLRAAVRDAGYDGYDAGVISAAILSRTMLGACIRMETPLFVVGMALPPFLCSTLRR